MVLRILVGVYHHYPMRTMPREYQFAIMLKALAWAKDLNGRAPFVGQECDHCCLTSGLDCGSHPNEHPYAQDINGGIAEIKCWIAVYRGHSRGQFLLSKQSSRCPMQIYNVEERDNEQALDADRLRRLLGIKLVLQHDRDAVRVYTQ